MRPGLIKVSQEESDKVRVGAEFVCPSGCDSGRLSRPSDGIKLAFQLACGTVENQCLGRLHRRVSFETAEGPWIESCFRIGRRDSDSLFLSEIW